MKAFIILYKILKRCLYKIDIFYSWIVTWLKFKLNGIYFHTDFIANGRPVVNINLKGKCIIGKRFAINSGNYHNMIGRQQKCYFLVGPGAKLVIGNNVGISSSAIVCNEEIIIEDFVKIGGNVVIYDSDFHSLIATERNNVPEVYNVKTKKVLIKEGAFIGAHSTILKGVIIGKNAIIGAGSVITKNVPDFEVWAGNPAVLIRKLDG